MYKVPLQNPSPDFESFEKVLRGEKEPEKVYFIELGIDGEVLKYIIENVMREKWIPLREETQKDYQKQIIDFYYKMSYDYVPLGPDWRNLPQFKGRKATDTANLSRGERDWVEEGGGIIKNWDDFEKINWDNIKYDLRALDYAQKNLPESMKITIGTTLFEMILERFLGYQDLFILSHDNPKLVEAVFEQWGQKVYDAYKEAIQYPKVGAIFHADDLGYKTGTMLNPEFLRKNVFPWFKKYASLAHEYGKTYWYHCCGYKDEIMEDFINDVKIDALHSFEDVCCPVTEFKRKYGDKIALLGGVDMDKLVRLDEENLRKYVRGILDNCMAGGRYALGSGNTVTNYIPVNNYLAMLDEGLKWR